MANSFIAAHKEVELRGYFMRHKSGGDVGFSWNKDDPKFSDQWERITAVPESPSSSTTAGGERQSIADDAEFQDLAGDVYQAGSHNESMEKPLNALIAHINTWAGRSAGDVVPAGYALVPKKITAEMIEAAMVAHYGKRRIEAVGGAGGVSMTVSGTDYNGVQAMRRLWSGALSAAPAADIKADAAAGAARQGGNTSESSNESCADCNSEVAAPTNTAPAVQPEPVDKRADAEVLRDLTKEYDTYMADRAALVMGQSFTEWKDGRMRQGQNSASNGATGEKA
jgi:hypothetical protein